MAKKITFHCPASTAIRLEKMSKLADMSRSRLILKMVIVMLDYLEKNMVNGDEEKK